MGAYRLFGGEAALEHALERTEASGVLVVGAGDDSPAEATLAAYLATTGSVDVYRLRIQIQSGTEGTDPRA